MKTKRFAMPITKIVRMIPLMALTLLCSLVITMPRSLNAQTIAQALDTPSWTWDNFGWYVIYDTGYGSGWVGGSAAMATYPGYGGDLYLQTSVTGPGKIQFFTESDSAFYGFYVDGVPISDLTLKYGYSTIDIPSGTHTLKWDCAGMAYGFTGGAVLDDVSFTNEGITTSSLLPAGPVGTAYNQTLTAIGGTLPYTWSITSGGLPLGLNLSADGVINGTPSMATNANFTVQVVGGSLSFAADFSLTIYQPDPTITTASPLPSGMIGMAYNQILGSSGSTTPYTWSIASGGLPLGLNLSTNGIINGTPTVVTNASFTVQVMGGNGHSTNKAFSIMIGPAITNTSPLPAGVIGTGYSGTLMATGGVAPYAWAVISGGLPLGLNLSTSGAINGTPSMATNASFTVQATDANGDYSSGTFSLAVLGYPSISTATPLTSGVARKSYYMTLAASGSTTPYTWSVIAGGLPSGLNLSSAGASSSYGIISGTPDYATNASLTVQVAGANGLSTNKAFSLMVGPTITTASTPSEGMSGNAYSHLLAATNGTPPYVWSIISGGLPQGLNLSNDGTLAGTPTMGTNASFTAKVTDANGTYTITGYTLTILQTSSQLAEAVDEPGWTVATSPNPAWYAQTSTTHDGADAAECELPTSYDTALMQTTVTGPGRISFYARIDNDSYYYYPDYLMAWGEIELYIDGQYQYQSSVFSYGASSTGWNNYDLPVASGQHTIKWNAIRSDWTASYAYVYAHFWVDQVTFTPYSPPVIVGNDGGMGLSTNGFGFDLSAVSGQTVVVEGSTNLVNWTPLRTNVMGDSPVHFSDPTSTNYPGRFYRLRSQ